MVKHKSNDIAFKKRPKAKVGKKAPTAVNVTDTTFKATSVKLKAQAVSLSKSINASPSNKRKRKQSIPPSKVILEWGGRSLAELLEQSTSHYAPAARAFALRGLKDALKLLMAVANDEEKDASEAAAAAAESAEYYRQVLVLHLSSLMPCLSKTMVDEDSTVRHLGRGLLKDFIFVPLCSNSNNNNNKQQQQQPVKKSSRGMAMSPFMPLHLAYMASALNSLNHFVRLDALTVVEFTCEAMLGQANDGNSKRYGQLLPVDMLLASFARLLMSTAGGFQDQSTATSTAGSNSKKKPKKKKKKNANNKGKNERCAVLRSLLALLRCQPASTSSILHRDPKTRSQYTSPPSADLTLHANSSLFSTPAILVHRGGGTLHASLHGGGRLVPQRLSRPTCMPNFQDLQAHVQSCRPLDSSSSCVNSSSASSSLSSKDTMELLQALRDAFVEVTQTGTPHDSSSLSGEGIVLAQMHWEEVSLVLHGLRLFWRRVAPTTTTTTRSGGQEEEEKGKWARQMHGLLLEALPLRMEEQDEDQDQDQDVDQDENQDHDVDSEENDKNHHKSKSQSLAKEMECHGVNATLSCLLLELAPHVKTKTNSNSVNNRANSSSGNTRMWKQRLISHVHAGLEAKGGATAWMEVVRLLLLLQEEDENAHVPTQTLEVENKSKNNNVYNLAEQEGNDREALLSTFLHAFFPSCLASHGNNPTPPQPPPPRDAVHLVCDVLQECNSAILTPSTTDCRWSPSSRRQVLLIASRFCSLLYAMLSRQMSSKNGGSLSLWSSHAKEAWQGVMTRVVDVLLQVVQYWNGGQKDVSLTEYGGGQEVELELEHEKKEGFFGQVRRDMEALFQAVELPSSSFHKRKGKNNKNNKNNMAKKLKMAEQDEQAYNLCVFETMSSSLQRLALGLVGMLQSPTSTTTQSLARILCRADSTGTVVDPAVASFAYEMMHELRKTMALSSYLKFVLYSLSAEMIDEGGEEEGAVSGKKSVQPGLGLLCGKDFQTERMCRAMVQARENPLKTFQAVEVCLASVLKGALDSSHEEEESKEYKSHNRWEACARARAVVALLGSLCCSYRGGLKVEGRKVAKADGSGSFLTGVWVEWVGDLFGEFLSLLFPMPDGSNENENAAKKVDGVGKEDEKMPDKDEDSPCRWSVGDMRRIFLPFSALAQQEISVQNRLRQELAKPKVIRRMKNAHVVLNPMAGALGGDAVQEWMVFFCDLLHTNK